MKYSAFHFSFRYTVLLLLLIILSCKQGPLEEEIVQNHPTGEVSRRYIRIDGKKHGKMTDYYPDGKILAERFFENDIQVGKSTTYFSSGQIKEVQYYDQGKIHGPDTVFYENGKPELIITLNHGLKDGYLRKYGRDGAVTYEAKYANDVLVEVKGEPVKQDTTKRITLDSLPLK